MTDKPKIPRHHKHNLDPRLSHCLPFRHFTGASVTSECEHCKTRLLKGEGRETREVSRKEG